MTRNKSRRRRRRRPPPQVQKLNFFLGTMWHVLCHLMLFCNEEPTGIFEKAKYSMNVKKALFLTLMHQATGGKAFIDEMLEHIFKSLMNR